MRASLRSLVLLAGTAGFLAQVVLADHRPTPPSSAQAAGAGQVGTVVSALGPDLRVPSVWIGPGTGDPFAALGRDLWVGETVSLICDVRMTAGAPTGWAIAWYIDGQKTCGEGVCTTNPTCEWPWPLTEGTTAYINYVPHVAGPHTYRCVVDIHNTVTESKEGNNAAQVSFTARLRPLDGTPLVIPRAVVPQLPVPGPQFRPRR